MDILVCVRQVPIIKGDVKFSTDGRSINIASYKHHINEWDLFALEEALQIKASHGGKVSTISIGDSQTTDALYYTLAAGVDEAIHIQTETQKLDNWQISYIIAKLIGTLSHDIVFTGVQAEDEGSGEIGANLSYLLNLPLATAVIAINKIEDGYVQLERELEEGYRDRLKIDLPFLGTIQSGIRQTRYVSTMRLRKARKKAKIESVSLSDLELDINQITPRKKVVNLTLPPASSDKLELITGDDADAIATNLIGKLKERGTL